MLLKMKQQSSEPDELPEVGLDVHTSAETCFVLGCNGVDGVLGLPEGS
jgi:hypothetical protein